MAGKEVFITERNIREVKPRVFDRDTTPFIVGGAVGAFAALFPVVFLAVVAGGAVGYGGARLAYRKFDQREEQPEHPEKKRIKEEQIFPKKEAAHAH